MEQMEEVGLGAEIFTVAVTTETGSGVGFYGPAVRLLYYGPEY